jgi:O-antigen/teichoic acid export membrane protein
VYAKNGAFMVASAARLLLVYNRAPLVAFAWVTLGEAVLAAIGLVIVYRRRGEGPGRWEVSAARARSLLRDSWPLILSGMVTMVYMRIDQVMLREMVGEREVGLYSAAVRLAEVWYLVPMALVASLYPNLVAAKQADEALFYRRLQRLYDLMAILGYAIAIPGMLLAGLVVRWLYGVDYREAAPMLAILVWTTVFVNLGVARSLFLTAMNWTRLHLFTVAVGGAVNVGLNLLLIPRYGGVGAAIATCVAYAMASYGACFLYRPLFPTGRMLTRSLFTPWAS